MKIYFLGTNGWYDSPTGNTSCALIDSQEAYVILDAGNGIYKIDRLIKTSKPIYLFISHFHLDHIIGLHTLNKFNFKQGLHIYGQPGTGIILNRLINKTFTVTFAQLPFKVAVHELHEGEHKVPFYIKCKFLKHISRCMGYRFKLENKIITYCTDTAFCQNAVELAEGADLLVAECSYKIARKNEKWPHLDPKGAAKIAKEAKAKRLALIHFDANIYKTLRDRKTARRQAARIFCRSFVAYDDLVINL